MLISVYADGLMPVIILWLRSLDKVAYISPYD